MNLAKSLPQRICTTLAVLLLAACSAPQTSAPVPPTATEEAALLPVTVATDIPYTIPLQPTVVERELDVYAPEEPGPWPVVIFAHGVSEDKEGYTRLSRIIAEQGAVVFTIDWPAINPASAAQARQMFECMACAVRFARAMASDYGGDPATVILTGFSAGAGTGSRVALIGDELDGLWEDYAAAEGGPPSQMACVATDTPVQVDAFVGIAGAYRRPQRLQELGPALWELPVDNGANRDLTIRLLHGEWDSTVPIEVATEFNNALLEAGYDTALTTFDSGHAIPTSLTVDTIMEIAEQ